MFWADGGVHERTVEAAPERSFGGTLEFDLGWVSPINEGQINHEGCHQTFDCSLDSHHL